MSKLLSLIVRVIQLKEQNNPTKGKRFLLVGGTINPHEPPFGGIVKIVEQHANTLIDKNHEVFIMSTRAIRNNAFRLLLHTPRLWVKYFISIWRAQQKLKWLPSKGFSWGVGQALLGSQIELFVDKYDPDVVFIYSLINGYSVPLLRKRIPAQTKLGLEIFGSLYTNKDFYLGQSNFIQEIVDSLDALLASSKHCASSLSELDIQKETRIIYGYTDTDRWIPTDVDQKKKNRVDLGFSENTDLVILYFGHLSKRLGLHTFLEAIPSILSRFPNAGCLIGGALEDQFLYNKAIELSKEWEHRIVIKADIQEGEVIKLYQASDVIVIPSLDSRSCGQYSMQEAMACELPVIATRVGGIPESVEENINAILIEPEDSGAILNWVTYLAENPQKAKSMGQRGREFVLKNRVKDVIDKQVSHFIEKMCDLEQL